MVRATAQHQVELEGVVLFSPRLDHQAGLAGPVARKVVNSKLAVLSR